MNCTNYQRKIVDAAAAGEELLQGDIAVHLQTCSWCRIYSEQQRALFQAMDSGLSVLVNSPVPPSLLPGVRARTEKGKSSSSFRLLAWQLGAMAGAVLLAVFLVLRWPRVQSRNPELQIAHAVTSEQPNATLVGHQARQPADKPVSIRSKQVRSKRTGSATQPSLQVIVLPEEREAFRKFVAQAVEDPDVSIALTRSAPYDGESAVEIAFLKINPLELEPLVPTKSFRLEDK